MTIWSITSSSGREKIECVSFSRIEHSNGLLLASIRIQGEFWERQIALDRVSLVNDYQFYISQVLLLTDSVKGLVEKLSLWLESYMEFEQELSNGKDQLLRISLGKSKDLIYKKDKPALTLEYSGGSCKQTRFCFLVDQTCITIFRNELINALQTIAEGY